MPENVCVFLCLCVLRGGGAQEYTNIGNVATNRKRRGKSLSEKVYEISEKTKEFI